MTDLRTAAQQALEALEKGVCVDPEDSHLAITALRAALADGDNLSPTGCDHCRHPLYAAIKCRQCGQPTERAENNTDWSAA